MNFAVIFDHAGTAIQEADRVGRPGRRGPNEAEILECVEVRRAEPADAADRAGDRAKAILAEQLSVIDDIRQDVGVGRRGGGTERQHAAVIGRLPDFVAADDEVVPDEEIIGGDDMTIGIGRRGGGNIPGRD